MLSESIARWSRMRWGRLVDLALNGAPFAVLLYFGLLELSFEKEAAFLFAAAGGLFLGLLITELAYIKNAIRGKEDQEP